MSATTTLKIGTRAKAEALFTYPNDGHETESLEDTITHYLSDSLRREGVQAQVADIRLTDDQCEIDIECEDSNLASAIGDRYQSFFDIGALGYAAAEAFKTSGEWDPMWKFLLPPVFQWLSRVQWKSWTFRPFR